MENFYIFLLLPFGGTLATRLRRGWQVWAVWGFIVLAVFLTAWLGKFLTEKEAGGALALASILGWIAPELWVSFRGFISRPRNIGLLIAGVGVIFILTQPKLLVGVMTLGIMIFGFWIMIRPFRK